MGSKFVGANKTQKPANRGAVGGGKMTGGKKAC
jgi:hypothetical protein